MAFPSLLTKIRLTTSDGLFDGVRGGGPSTPYAAMVVLVQEGWLVD